MVSCFAAIWCPQINEHGGKVPNSQPKLYLLDPLIASLGSYVRAGLGRSDSTQLTENAMGIAMARAIDASEEGRWMSQDTIGYLRSGKGNEIDLSPVPVPTASGVEYTTPLESKWVSHGWRGESRSVDSKFGRGILATRNIIDTTTSVWALPAPLVALLLG